MTQTRHSPTYFTKQSKHIPVGRIRNTDKLLPHPIRNKIAHRNLTSKNTPQDPNISELNKDNSTLTNTNKTDIWSEHIEKPWHYRQNTSTYWNTIHGLAHKRPTQLDNNSITLKDKTHINPKNIASAFNKQFVNTIPHKTNTTNRKKTENYTDYIQLRYISQPSKSKQQSKAERTTTLKDPITSTLKDPITST